MSSNTVVWDCCGETTVTDGWAPTECPFCTSESLKSLLQDRDLTIEALRETVGLHFSTIGRLLDQIQAQHDTLDENAADAAKWRELLEATR